MQDYIYQEYQIPQKQYTTTAYQSQGKDYFVLPDVVNDYSLQIKRYIKNLWKDDVINTQDICDTFDLCVKGVKVRNWYVDSSDKYKMIVELEKPIKSYLYYKNIPFKFEIKQTIAVKFSENGSSKVMHFLAGALKGTKIIDIAIASIEFDNFFYTEEKQVKLGLKFFLGSKTVNWELTKLQTVLESIVWP